MTDGSNRYFRFDRYFIDTEDNILLRGREVLALGSAASRILSALVKRKGEILTRKALKGIGWEGVHVEEDSIYKSIEKIRKILAERSDRRQYIKTVRNKGYRFIADTEAVSEESWKRIIAPRPGLLAEHPPPKEEPRPETIRRADKLADSLFLHLGDVVQRPLQKVALLMLIAMALNLLLPMTQHQAPTQHQASQMLPVIAGAMILPITGVNSNDEDVASRINTKLKADFKKDLNPFGPQISSEIDASKLGFPQNDPLESGNAIPATIVFSGTAEIRKDMIRVHANLKRVRDKLIIWQKTIEESLRDLDAAIDSIARSISREVIEFLAVVSTDLAPAKVSPNAPSGADYSEGDRLLATRTPSSIRMAIEAFLRAINKEPSNALAYANLANAYILIGGVGYNEMPPQEAFPKAQEAATKALELDTNLPEAHAAQAMVKLFYDYDFDEADREFRRAIFLSLIRKDEDVVARHWYANCLTLVGRFDEGLVQIRRAKELAPSSLIINATIGWTHYFARDYDQAIKECKKALELDDNFYVIHAFLGLAYAQKLMYKEAIGELSRAKELSQNSPVMVAELGRVQALSGNKNEATKALSDLQVLSTQHYVSPYSIAMVYVGLGDKDAAFEWLNKAFNEHSGWLVHMKVEPALDSLRTDERFGKLLKRVGLPN